MFQYDIDYKYDYRFLPRRWGSLCLKLSLDTHKLVHAVYVG